MRIPKLRKHSSGQGRVTLNGRTIYLGKLGSKECLEKYNRLISEWIANGVVVIPDDAKDNLTLSEMMLVYLKWATKHYGKERGELDRIKRIIKRTKSKYSKLPASEFSYVQFEAVRQSLVARPVGRNYVNECMKRLVRIFKWAASRGLIQPSVPQALSMIEPLKRGVNRRLLYAHRADWLMPAESRPSNSMDAK